MVIAFPDERVSELRLSPDGRSAFFLSQGRIFRVAVDGATPQLLFEVSNPENVQCTVRPANFCAYGSNSEDGRELVITEFDPDSGNRKELLHVPKEPGWHRAQWGLAPDGSEVAVVKSEGKTKIEFIPLRGATPRIFPVEGYQWPNSVVWTSDSKGLFSEGLDTNGSLTILHIDRQGHVEAVWHQPNYSEAAIWAVPSPDGRHIAIAGGKTDHDVWMIEDF